MVESVNVEVAEQARMATGLEPHPCNVRCPEQLFKMATWESKRADGKRIAKQKYVSQLSNITRMV